MIKEGYTRVSEIVGWFKAITLGSIDPGVLKRKALLGTEVHEAIAGFYEGVFVPLDQKAAPYYESFKRWSSCQEMKILKQEERYYNDSLLITGAVDMISDYHGIKHLIDFKTSATADKKAWRIQGALYTFLYGDKIDNIRFVKLDKNGKDPDIFDFVPDKQAEEDAMICLKAYRIWHH